MSGPSAADALQPAGFFVLRTPLLSFDEIAGALASGEGLLAACGSPALREAVFLASPRVEEALAAWVGGGPLPDGMEPVLASYLLRAATRPTPYGLFSGWSTGTIGPRTSVELAGRDDYRPHSRLDMDYLETLADAIDADPELRQGPHYRPNAGLCRVAGRLHVAEARQDDGHRSHHLVAYEGGPALTATLARAAGGARLDALSTALVDGDVTPEAAGRFVAELVAGQLLVSDARPPVTGDDPAGPLRAALQATPAGAKAAAVLDAAHHELAALDEAGVGAAAGGYRNLAGLMADLPVPAPLDRLVQADLEKPAVEATLGADVVAEVERAVRLLHRLAPASGDDELARLRPRFAARHGDGPVPLAEALDEEHGTGFSTIDSPVAEGGPLLAGLAFGVAEEPESWTAADTLRLGLLTRALAAGAFTVELDPAELEQLPAPPDPLPDALYALVAVAAASEAELNAGRFQVVVDHAAGPSGANLLGRFCGADPRLRRLVEDHLREEEAHRPDAVYAEIVHLPEGRTGNILQRPVLRSHEIPYLGTSGAPPDRQLPVDDLVVSLDGERFVLHSRRLGREVLPRLTTAHDYRRFGLPLYRFLAALQDQGVACELSWDWGPLRHAPFLPRVTSGRVVLSPARWNLGPAELAAFRAALADGPAAVAGWRAGLGLPGHLTLVDEDRRLFTDLDSPLAVAVLAHQLKTRTAATLDEAVPGPGELWARGPEGRFAHELVIPFARPAPTAPATHFRPPAAAALEQPGARHLPGSSWLYAKLYTGPATADRVLTGTLGPLAEQLLESGATTGWFFLRHADPEPHLRVRLRGDPDRLHGEALPALQQAAATLAGQGRLWRLVLDTYQPEEARYGGPAGIGLAEDIFCADSRAVVAALGHLPGDHGLGHRWRLALRGIDRLLAAAGFAWPDRRAVAADAAAAYGAEFGVDGRFRQEVSKRFRQERAVLETLIGTGAAALPSALAGAAAAFDAAWEPAAAAAAELGRRQGDGLSQPLAEIVTSLAHLHVNRMLRSAQRAQELVLYELLERLYSRPL